MQLKEYVDKYCINVAGLARRIGTTRTYFYKMMNGHVPSVKMAKRIEEATFGNVTKEEILFPDEYPK